MTRSRKRKLQRLHGGHTAMRALAAGVPTLLAGMSAAYAQTTSGGLEEIVVTAQKRTEDLQSVPLSIQAIGTQRLQELNVQRFDDYVRFLPSVSYQTVGPGFAAVYMRGVASGGDGNHSASLPSVGIYLDEQPITTIQGALDVHLYDIARVEALAGPQGTLYGASSQAGTIRIITNRPDPAEFDAGLRTRSELGRRRRHRLPGRGHGQPADQRPHRGPPGRLAPPRRRLHRQRLSRAHVPDLGHHGRTMPTS